ncbi:MAG: RHS repeat protein, partial [Clostridia bacterium]|nr:RHS repeat protein [Clostridia bacterium]
MRKLKTGIVSLVLSTVMFAQAVPMEVWETFAEGVDVLFETEENVKVEETITGGLSDANNIGNGYIIQENVEKRTETTKEFLMSDDTILVQQFADEVHYYDGSVYQEIDNTLVEKTESDGTEYYENESNSFKVKFQKNGKTDLKLVEVEEDGYKLKIKYKSKTDKKEKKLKTKVEKSKKKEKVEYKDKKLKKPAEYVTPTGGITYKEIEDNVNLTYEVQGNKLKENIVVSELQEEYSYTFEVDAKDLYFVQNENGSIHLNDTKGETKFVIPAPFMYDSEGQYSNAVYYTLNEKNDKAEITVTADSEWINTQASLPVTIDPIIESFTQKTFSYVNVYNDDEKTVTTTGNMYVGEKGGTTSHAFLKFDILSKGAQYAVVDASLDFTYGIGNNKNVYCELYTADTDVAFSNIRYNNRPSKLQYLFPINQEDLLQPDYESYSTAIRVSDIKYDSLTIGIECLEKTSNNGYIVIYPSGDYVPSLTLKYKYIAGVEDDYSMETFTIDGATGYVNNATGLLTLNCDVASVNTMGSLPLNTSLIYNSEYNSILEEFGIEKIFGNHFKLNFQQYLKKGNDSTYQYIDGDGSIITFYRDDVSDRYFAHTKNLILTETGIQNLIIDPQGNQLEFQNKRLKKIIPAKESGTEWIEISYLQSNNADTNKISQVLYKETSMNLQYTISFTYTNDKVTGITTKKGTTTLLSYSLTYDANGFLTNVINTTANVTLYHFNYWNISDTPLEAVFNCQQDGLFFSYPAHGYKVWKVTSVSGTDINDGATRFYDYAEFTYSGITNTKIVYYSDNNPTTTKNVAFNTSRYAISEWIEDESGNVTVSNMGNWKCVWAVDFWNDYTQENYVYEEKISTNGLEWNSVSSGASLAQTIQVHNVPTNTTYYKHVLGIKLKSTYKIDVSVSVNGVTEEVVLVNGGEVYVSIPCGKLYSGAQVSVKNNATIGTVNISRASYTVADYTKVVKSYHDSTYGYGIKEIVSQGTNGEWSKTIYNAYQRTESVETSSINDTAQKKTYYEYANGNGWDADLSRVQTKRGDEVLSSTNYTYENSTANGTLTSKTVVETEQGEYKTRTESETVKTANSVTTTQTDVNNLTQTSYYTLSNGDMRLTKTESGNTRTVYAYNNLGQITQVYVYDISQGVEIKYAQTNQYDGGRYVGTVFQGDQYEYNYGEENGALVNSIDYNGTAKQTYHYAEEDGFYDGRALQSVAYANGQTKTYTYETNKQTVNYTGASATDAYEYATDAYGRMTSQTHKSGAGLNTKLVYEYLHLGEPYQYGFTVNYLQDYLKYTEEYDPYTNRLKNYTVQTGKTCLDTKIQTGVYSYDEKGRLSETRYDGYYTELTYDEANRLNGYTLSYNGFDIVNQTYVYKTYTKNGVTYTTNQLSKIENPLSYGTNTCYENEYDANGYVTSVSYNGNTYAYTYDSVGRLTSETVNGTTKNYTYDNKNNIQKTGLTYGANGQLTAVNGAQIVYDG